MTLLEWIVHEHDELQDELCAESDDGDCIREEDEEEADDSLEHAAAGADSLDTSNRRRQGSESFKGTIGARKGGREALLQCALESLRSALALMLD
jgi:hypothetical protein